MPVGVVNPPARRLEDPRIALVADRDHGRRARGHGCPASTVPTGGWTCRSGSWAWATSGCRWQWRSPRPARRSSAWTSTAAGSRRCAEAGRTSRTSTTSAWPASPAASRPRRGRPRWRSPTRSIICVPTPLTPNREPDLTPLLDAGRTLASVLQPGQLVVLESTTYPGTTRERLAPLLEESGLAAGARLRTWPSRPSASTRAVARTTLPHDAEGRRRPDRDLRRPRRGALRARRARRSSASPRRRSPRWRSSWRTSSGRSTSRWSTSSPSSPTAWASTSTRSSTPPRPSRSASCASTRARAWAATACPSTRSTSAGRHASSSSRTEFIELAGKVNQQAPYVAVDKVRAPAQRARHGRPRREGRGPRRRLQARPLRHPRVARAEDHRAPAGSSAAEVAYHDELVPELPEPRPGERLARQDVLADCDVAVIVTAAARHRPPRDRRPGPVRRPARRHPHASRRAAPDRAARPRRGPARRADRRGG